MEPSFLLEYSVLGYISTWISGLKVLIHMDSEWITLEDVHYLAILEHT